MSGCSTKESDINKAIQVAKEYKTLELEASKPAQNTEVSMEQIRNKEESVKPLMTSVFFEQNAASRTYQRAFAISQYKQSEIVVSDLEFTKKNQSDDEIELSYKGTMSFAKEQIALDGIITLLKENDAWKVNNDVYNMEALIKILDEMISK
ncbi:hypothetical protein [Paenibacillus sp. Marseille-Q4541]|uniref:hypothetical protein n=1 Tax=Paenibacillus sp. Marseille-Q4541 TaxID=2831522 RepID=UPI001BADEB3C|nr:hypothetical protein [Paenibacillus sp. Marseille-Q4541]